MQTNDAIYKALTDAGFSTLYEWLLTFKAGPSSNINDLWRDALLELTGLPADKYNWNDYYSAYLSSNGYAGSLADQQNQFWSDVADGEIPLPGGGTPPVEKGMFTVGQNPNDITMKGFAIDINGESPYVFGDLKPNVFKGQTWVWMFIGIDGNGDYYASMVNATTASIGEISITTNGIKTNWIATNQGETYFYSIATQEEMKLAYDSWVVGESYDFSLVATAIPVPVDENLYAHYPLVNDAIDLLASVSIKRTGDTKNVSLTSGVDSIPNNVAAVFPNHLLADDTSVGGLLVEKEGKQKVAASNDFANAVYDYKGGASIGDLVESPTGELDARTINYNSNLNARVEQVVNLGPPFKTYTLTTWAKSLTGQTYSNATLGVTSAVGGQQSPIIITPQWKRFRHTSLQNGNAEYPQLAINEEGSIAIYNFQLEPVEFESSDIINETGSDATRISDRYTLPLTTAASDPLAFSGYYSVSPYFRGVRTENDFSEVVAITMLEGGKYEGKLNEKWVGGTYGGYPIVSAPNDKTAVIGGLSAFTNAEVKNIFRQERFYEIDLSGSSLTQSEVELIYSEANGLDFVSYDASDIGFSFDFIPLQNEGAILLNIQSGDDSYFTRIRYDAVSGVVFQHGNDIISDTNSIVYGEKISIDAAITDTALILNGEVLTRLDTRNDEFKAGGFLSGGNNLIQNLKIKYSGDNPPPFEDKAKITVGTYDDGDDATDAKGFSFDGLVSPVAAPAHGDLTPNTFDGVEWLFMNVLRTEYDVGNPVFVSVLAANDLINLGDIEITINGVTTLWTYTPFFSGSSDYVYVIEDQLEAKALWEAMTIGEVYDFDLKLIVQRSTVKLGDMGTLSNGRVGLYRANPFFVGTIVPNMKIGAGILNILYPEPLGSDRVRIDGGATSKDHTIWINDKPFEFINDGNGSSCYCDNPECLAMFQGVGTILQIRALPFTGINLLEDE